jgi:hypothetical protein
MADGRAAAGEPDLGGRATRVVLVLILLTCGGWPESAGAIAPQYQCSTSYDAAKSYCEPVEKTPWRWSVDMHYGTPVQAYFLSEGAALAIVPPRFMTAGPGGWCSDVYSHTAYDSQPITCVAGGRSGRDAQTQRRFGLDLLHPHRSPEHATPDQPAER